MDWMQQPNDFLSMSPTSSHCKCMGSKCLGRCTPYAICGVHSGDNDCKKFALCGIYYGD